MNPELISETDGLPLLSQHDSKPAEPVFDKSRAFQRIRAIGAWPLAERLIDLERKRLRAEGCSRAEAGSRAWQIADAEFTREQVRLGQETLELQPATPPGLENSQVGAWRLGVVLFGVATQRSARLIPFATRLIVQTRLRTAMKLIGEYEISSDVFLAPMARLETSRETCLEEVDRVIKTLKGIEFNESEEELIDELTVFLEGLNVAREVLSDKWETTSLAVPLNQKRKPK